METRRLIIIRGPSGSGKTTIARHIQEQCILNIIPAGWRSNLTALEHNIIVPVCEADTFWGPNYAFDPNRLHQAHQWCLLEVTRHMIAEKPVVLITGTLAKTKDLKPYQELAEGFGYEIEVIRSPGPWDFEELKTRGEARDRRNTPDEVIQRHMDQYVSVDGETEWTDLSIFSKGK